MTPEERLDNLDSQFIRIVGILASVAERHDEFNRELRGLLRVQVQQQDTLNKLALKSLETEEKLDALIRIVDGHVTRHPPASGT